MTNVLARGKCYNLTGMKSLDEEQAEEMLVRHSQICHLIGGHPHIATNLSCKKSIDENSWWVIDQWVAGKSLGDVLRNGPLEITLLRTIMTQVATGLLALHKAGVVYRHLNPSSILLREPDDSVVLTDFEHGKLFQHSITVKPAEGFRMDPYFAPEVSKNVDRRADIYSFGHVFMTAALGEPPPIGKAGKAPKPNKIPPSVWNLMVDCCETLPSKRPTDATELLESLASWK
jgi:serine/threonine protein kinase